MQWIVFGQRGTGSNGLMPLGNVGMARPKPQVVPEERKEGFEARKDRNGDGNDILCTAFTRSSNLNLPLHTLRFELPLFVRFLVLFLLASPCHDAIPFGTQVIKGQLYGVGVMGKRGQVSFLQKRRQRENYINVSWTTNA